MENLNPQSLESICKYVYRETLNGTWRAQNNESAMLIQLARSSTCQFVYREILGAIYRVKKNRGPIFILRARDPKKCLNMQWWIHTCSIKISCP
jgi:hypothetical protein